jgi:ferredoxin
LIAGCGGADRLADTKVARVKVHIDAERCQGHGRCYDLAPEIFGEDDEGYGQVLGDGMVSPGAEPQARLGALNCPEAAVTVTEGA